MGSPREGGGSNISRTREQITQGEITTTQKTEILDGGGARGGIPGKHGA